MPTWWWVAFALSVLVLGVSAFHLVRALRQERARHRALTSKWVLRACNDPELRRIYYDSSK